MSSSSSSSTTTSSSLTESSQINTYYGNVILRCVPILDYLNNRYIELPAYSPEAEQLLDNLNILYRFHSNPISYIYNSFMYYDQKFHSTNSDLNRSKKKRLFQILACNNTNNK